MGPLDPIAGISLERYADLCAKMKDCGGDLEVCARIAGENGVDRATWQSAMDGWNKRMSDPATAGQVALAYMPLYQAALARTGMSASASFEDYCGMSAMLNHPRYGLDAMYRHYGIEVQAWSQISMYWVDRLTKDPALASQFAAATGKLRTMLDAGQVPQPGLGAKPSTSGAAIAAAAQAVAELPPVAVGENCFVLWNDGNRYVGKVERAEGGKCLVSFPGGRQEWIPYQYIKGS
jgi:hypothetical protein